MKTPVTVKGYLKMLITIANESSCDLNNITEDEMMAIGHIRAEIQNVLSDSEIEKILNKYNLKYDG